MTPYLSALKMVVLSFSETLVIASNNPEDNNECIVVLWVVASSISVITIEFLKICNSGMITYLLNRKRDE